MQWTRQKSQSHCPTQGEEKQSIQYYVTVKAPAIVKDQWDGMHCSENKHWMSAFVIINNKPSRPPKNMLPKVYKDISRGLLF